MNDKENEASLGMMEKMSTDFEMMMISLFDPWPAGLLLITVNYPGKFHRFCFERIPLANNDSLALLDDDNLEEKMMIIMIEFMPL